METFDMLFFHEQSGATAVLTFTNRGQGSVNVNVSLRHDTGLSDFKMRRYVALWQKWTRECCNLPDEGEPIPPKIPAGWQGVRTNEPAAHINGEGFSLTIERF